MKHQTELDSDDTHSNRLGFQVFWRDLSVGDGSVVQGSVVTDGCVGNRSSKAVEPAGGGP